jgi:error-prone DNA polymerase
MPPNYAELHCLSNFTFLRGASHPEELVLRAHELGYSALAITDECSVAGVVRAHVAAKECGLKLIIGSEFILDDGLRLVLLATNREGYGNLSGLITQGRRKGNKGAYRLSRSDLAKGVPACLALWLPGKQPDANELSWLNTIFEGRCWIVIELLTHAGDKAYLSRLESLGKKTGIPLVASGDIHMHSRDRRLVQDTLTAIRHGCTLVDAGYQLYPNGERHLRTRERLAQLYSIESMVETIRIAELCTFSLDELRYEYPEEIAPKGVTASSHLRQLTMEGLQRRYPDGTPAKVNNLIERELRLIAELDYEPYFLTVYDIVRFARERNILCQGRGSAANSAVCYALGITEVDPALMAMLFERFISRERKEPPDIDVDFEHERREEVIQYLYEKYGRDRAALAATVITYQRRSAIRDVGKALGLALDQLEKLVTSMAWWDGNEVLPDRIRDAGFDPEAQVISRLITLVNVIVGFPRHLSQHVGGFVFSRGPLSHLVPIENAAMPDRTVIQWDKDDLDALGLLKVDVLSLGMLTAIRKTLDLMSMFRGRRLAMQDIPREDPKVYDMICRADTIGVFQIESRAQMSMLPRHKPREFYDLVVEVAIVRPGPIQGGMVHPYLKRRLGLEPVTYPSDAVKAVLKRTLGIPIFQEQVMQLCVDAAGFTPGEADQLRRAMAAWRRRSGLEPFETKLKTGMRDHGYSEEFAEQIYKQICGFASYGFPESHSASFALLVYVSAWLKCYEPAAFTCALLNSLPMGFYQPAQLIRDARDHGVEVKPIDVQSSEWDSILERKSDGEPAIRLGFREIKGMSQAAARRLMEARRVSPFESISDVARRATLNVKDLACLANAGAFASLAGHRREAAWQTAGVEYLPSLLAQADFTEASPDLPRPTEAEDIVADYRHIGFTLGRHPLALLRKKLAAMHFRTASEINTLQHGRLSRFAGIVTCRQHPETASGVTFVTLEDETGFVNVVVWRDLGDKQRKELLGARLMGVQGVVEREGEVMHLVARRLIDHSDLLGQIVLHSRDFF